MDRQTTDLKVVVLGDASVGKTAFINRYCNDTFLENTLSTIGAGFYSKPKVKIPDHNVSLMLWDTAGEERFRSVAPSILRGADGLILVFDVTQPQTLDDLSIYYDMFLDTVHVNPQKELPILVLGNKIDLPNKTISQEQLDVWCNRKRIVQKELISVKTGERIEDIMTDFVKMILKPGSTEPTPFIVPVEPSSNQSSGCKC